ncbi:MAG: hypothetical protein IJW29_07100 [Clostridia bacterium]|nr:hypothetical protein [Clostridia bacterium]
MEAEKKKQFSLSILVRIFLVLLAVIAIGVFAASVMRYNELKKEAEELQKTLSQMRETRDELEEILGSAEEVDRLLRSLEDCEAIINSGTHTGDVLKEYLLLKDEVMAQLKSSKNRKYIERVAKDELNLYFADEEIYYNDINQ